MSAQPIAIINQAKTSMGVDLGALLAASQIYVEQHLHSAWGVHCRLYEAPAVPSNAWSIVLLDNADQAGALGYHDLSSTGMPFGKIFVETTVKNGEIPSVTFSHELAEMLIDPFCEQLMVNLNNGAIYPKEVCDAVEEDTFLINGIKFSNFVYPAWFQGWRAPRSTHFDYLGTVSSPFELRPDGYASIIKEGNFQTIWGSADKELRWKKEDRRGHRLEEIWQKNVAHICINPPMNGTIG